MQRGFAITVNGVRREVACGPDRPLIDVLREDLRLTGTKRGCGIGACGACTVLVDGKPKKACRVTVSDVDSSEIITIEGLARGDELHPIQQAFLDCGAIQCGFCTPGMVLAAKALLDERPSPTREEIRNALRGNLCRCTGYQQIFEAVEEAAEKLGGKG